MLLVARGSVPSATAAELARLKPGRIVVLGGTTVINNAVAAALQAYATSGTVTRLAGADRYATAIAVSVATTAPTRPRTVYVATGETFADGLAGTPAAARANGPLLILPRAPDRVGRRGAPPPQSAAHHHPRRDERRLEHARRADRGALGLMAPR